MPDLFRLLFVAIIALSVCPLAKAAEAGVPDYERDVLPILETHCFDCHADGEKKGDVQFDAFASSKELMAQTELWVKCLKNVRGDLMPPAKKPRLSSEEFLTLETWIKQGALKLDPLILDPGRVTLRRLNRIEYRNTIRDLMGVDFRTDEEFPADDTGYGFDTIGDVLTTSPLLMEKYMQASEAIVAKAVPLINRVIPSARLKPEKLKGIGDDRRRGDELVSSLYDALDLAGVIAIEKAGTYKISLDARIDGSFDFDTGRAAGLFELDGTTVWKEEIKWHDSKPIIAGIELKLEPGEHSVRLKLQPLVDRSQQPKDRGDGAPFVDFHFEGIQVVGPTEKEFAAHPANYDRFFTREEVPEVHEARLAYAKEILLRFVPKAFRRPVDDTTINKLAGLAMNVAGAPDGSFEKGVARAISATLASPRFLFRMEDTLPEADETKHPLIDEYALASRLSYFLWSTMPDETLLALASKGELRNHLPEQVQRLLADDRSDEFSRNFAGQWLQTRDVESVSIDARVVQARDAGTEKENRGRFELRQRLNREIDEAEKAHDEARLVSLRQQMNELRAKFGTKRIEFSGDLRRAMRREAELFFRHLLKDDRSVLELLETDSTYLNQTLADFYGIPDVKGGEMRLVKLPSDSVRGGVLTMGNTLAVTSNPTRTSPVKRGLFILENLLGTPPPPPPPDVPSLEASEATSDGHEPSLREVLAKHREMALCSSCHNRMDPLGLALENFNAMGLWREKERGQPIPPSAGELVTGEKFANVSELKHILATTRRKDFYRCLTEKLLTYSLGRGPEVCDIPTIDAMVDKLEQTSGKFSTLIMGIIESTPFQKRHRSTP